MAAASKSAVPARRAFALMELVIPDFQQMDATGRFDRNVLLWLQAAYVSRALRDSRDAVLDLHRELSRMDFVEPERCKRQTEFLTKIATEAYSAAKAQGGGFDLKQYVEAAQVLHESESMRCAGQLGELVDYIRQSTEVGIKPDLERFAREVYLILARMSEAIGSLDGIGAQNSAQQAAQMLKAGIERFARISSPAQAVPVGRLLLKRVDLISQAPDQHMQVVDPYRQGGGGPWDFEPVRRSGGTELASRKRS